MKKKYRRTNERLANENLILISRKEKKFNKKYKLTQPLNLILIIMIILIIFMIFRKIKSLYTKKKILVENTSNYRYEKFFNINEESLFINYAYKDDIKNQIIPNLKYIELSKRGILLHENNFKKSENPKITIVISTFNRQQYINSALRSIQNQDLLDIEIIVIDDFSDDNTTAVVKDFQKNDPRIILLQNKENMGTLYSKSIGVLYARGQYIQSLDSDDMLCNQHYLSMAYNETIISKANVVGAQALYINEIEKKISRKEPFWVVLWSKIIRRELYQEAIYNVGLDILNMKIKTLDDDIIARFLFIYQRIKKINVLGPAHFTHQSEHVYSNAFKSGANLKTFCLNLVNTIKAFYMFNDRIGEDYAIFLTKYNFIRGPCVFLKHLEQVKSLNMNFTDI